MFHQKKKLPTLAIYIKSLQHKPTLVFKVSNNLKSIKKIGFFEISLSIKANSN